MSTDKNYGEEITMNELKEKMKGKPLPNRKAMRDQTRRRNVLAKMDELKKAYDAALRDTTASIVLRMEQRILKSEQEAAQRRNELLDKVQNVSALQGKMVTSDYMAVFEKNVHRLSDELTAEGVKREEDDFAIKKSMEELAAEVSNNLNGLNDTWHEALRIQANLLEREIERSNKMIVELAIFSVLAWAAAMIGLLL